MTIKMIIHIPQYNIGPATVKIMMSSAAIIRSQKREEAQDELDDAEDPNVSYGKALLIPAICSGCEGPVGA
jgi:hypothetical protein